MLLIKYTGKEVRSCFIYTGALNYFNANYACLAIKYVSSQFDIPNINYVIQPVEHKSYFKHITQYINAQEA